MPASNSTMIRKLQGAINKVFNEKILINQSQWYSDDKKEVKTIYIIKKTIYNEDLERNMTIELFNTYSQIQVVLFLRDYWYQLNGWEVPTDNPEWEKAKAKYYSK